MKVLVSEERLSSIADDVYEECQRLIAGKSTPQKNTSVANSGKTLCLVKRLEMDLRR